MTRLLALALSTSLAWAGVVRAQQLPRISLLHGDGTEVDLRGGALSVSHAITNDGSLVRGNPWGARSADPDDVRVNVSVPDGRQTGTARIESLDPDTGAVHASLDVPLAAPRAGDPLRSPYLRLVGDAADAEAPGVTGQVLRVALRDVVRVTFLGQRVEVRVGRPGSEDGELAARRVRVVMHVLRSRIGGAPLVGRNDGDAVRLAREQIGIADEVWLQCMVTFGRPEEADVRVEDPPPAWLLAIADGDGLPAVGGGVLRLRADGRAIAPVTTRAGARPVETALDVASALRAIGLHPTVIENPVTENGAGHSADVLVRARTGRPVTLTADAGAPLGTDARQHVSIGSVDLTDGLQEFDNMNASAGSLEERTLVRALADTDPSTIDLFVVGRFAQETRQGEAFIEGDGRSAITDVVILDRNGLRQSREAWTQSHEVGHALLDDPYHPDNVGPDRPWLLMDADSSAGLVTGPKRLSRDECARVRAMSGPDTVPPLLSRDVP